MIYFKFSFLCHAVLHIGSQFPDQPGIEPIPPAMEVRVLTTGLPGKSPKIYSFKRFNDN